MGREDLESTVDAFDICFEGWDILLIQEGPAPEGSCDECHEISGRHLLYIGALQDRPRSVAILLHRRWASSKHLFRQKSGRTVFLDIIVHDQPSYFISSHLPHSDDPLVSFQAELEILTEIVQAARQKKIRYVLGVDANAVVGKQLPSDNPRVVGGHGVGERTARGEEFVSFAHICRSVIANTMFQKRHDLVWTHRSWSTGELRQIDFVLLCDSLRSCRQNLDTSDIFKKSDHRSLLMVLRGFLDSAVQKSVNNSSQRRQRRCQKKIDEAEKKQIQ